MQNEFQPLIQSDSHTKCYHSTGDFESDISSFLTDDNKTVLHLALKDKLRVVPFSKVTPSKKSTFENGKTLPNNSFVINSFEVIPRSSKRHHLIENLMRFVQSKNKIVYVYLGLAAT